MGGTVVSAHVVWWEGDNEALQLVAGWTTSSGTVFCRQCLINRSDVLEQYVHF